METLIGAIFSGAGVVLLGYIFTLLGVKSDAQRAIVFVLAIIGGTVQLYVQNKLNVTSDPQTWMVVILAVQGAAQGLYTVAAKGFGWSGSKDGGATNPT